MLIVFNINNLRKSGAKLRILKVTFYDLNHKKRARRQEGKKAKSKEKRKQKRKERKERSGTLLFSIQVFVHDSEIGQCPYFLILTDARANDICRDR
jgi:hypothetical protein